LQPIEWPLRVVTSTGRCNTYTLSLEKEVLHRPVEVTGSSPAPRDELPSDGPCISVVSFTKDQFAPIPNALSYLAGELGFESGSGRQTSKGPVKGPLVPFSSVSASLARSFLM